MIYEVDVSRCFTCVGGVICEVISTEASKGNFELQEKLKLHFYLEILRSRH